MTQQIERIGTLTVADLAAELCAVKKIETWALLLPFSYGSEAEDYYVGSFCGKIKVDYGRRCATGEWGVEMFVRRAIFCDRLVGVEFDRVYVPASGLEAEGADNAQSVSLSEIPSVLKFCHGRVIAYDSITARAKEGTNAE